ncbi:MAG TPA: methionyl-tRNA formyltransferase [Clostridia bacterium]
MRIIFMGTPEFAVPCLEMLIENKYQVAAVVTQPDKPKGRGGKMTPPPIKEVALRSGIDVLQPIKVRTLEYAELLRSYKPDLFITCAYGRILTKEVLSIPPLGCINVHASLLPAYRGAAPIQWAVINGEKVTGITTMFTDEGLDTGDMLLSRELKIGDDTIAGELHDQLSVMGAELLKDTLLQLSEGTLKRIPQPNEGVTYAPIIEKDIGRLDFTKSAKQLHDLVRGTNPWPVAFTFLKGERMRVFKTDVLDKVSECEPGTIINVDDEGILVACGNGILRISELQFDSSKRMSVQSYLRGHTIDKGEKLG